MHTSVTKVPYICGPLTDLPPEIRDAVKQKYVEMADACLKIFGLRAFVPHEHYDPIKNAAATPTEVDAVERRQVCECTSILLVMVYGPSWGGGIEVEMAFRSLVPTIIFRPNGRSPGRLCLGNPGVSAIIEFDDSEPMEAVLVRGIEAVGVPVRAGINRLTV